MNNKHCLKNTSPCILILNYGKTYFLLKPKYYTNLKHPTPKHTHVHECIQSLSVLVSHQCLCYTCTVITGYLNIYSKSRQRGKLNKPEIRNQVRGLLTCHYSVCIKFDSL